LSTVHDDSRLETFLVALRVVVDQIFHVEVPALVEQGGAQR
jgi:hypothetical protein